MQGYGPETYGAAFAGVYDEWYGSISDVATTVEFLEGVAQPSSSSTPDVRRRLRILELAVGTGRLAIPLARRGHDVTGVDISPDMLAVLSRSDPDGLVRTHHGDMVDDVPAGPFDLVVLAFNSIFMLTEPDRQAACVRAAAGALDERGALVVEAFVPDDVVRNGDEVTLRSMTAQRVVLSVTSTDASAQRVEGQFVELVHGEPVRLHPYALRYATPAELDEFATAAGLTVAARYEDVTGTPFVVTTSTRHVTVYRRDATARGG